MGVVTALLVVGSALLHAVWNAILKRTRSPEDAAPAIVVVTATTALLVVLVLGQPLPPPRSIAWCVVSGVLEALYFVTLARAFARAPLGPVYTTVRGGALVIVWPISIAFLGEHVTLGIGCGTLLVAAGLLATGGSEMPASLDRTWRERLAGMNLGWAALCATFVGGYQVAYKFALAAGGASQAVVAVSIGTAFVSSFVFGGRSRARAAWAAARAEPALVLAGGILTTASFGVFMLALDRGGAGAVATLRNTSILFAQVIAFAMGERPKRLGIAGALLVTAGAVLLART
jgi:uncharacterized membrane protein